MRNRLFALLLAGVTLLAACTSSSNPSSSYSGSAGSESTPSSQDTMVDEADIIKSLNSDEYAGNVDASGSNSYRVIDDEVYNLVEEKKRILEPGETYVEDFEKDSLHTKLYPSKVTDSGASFMISSMARAAINGKSLYLSSNGNYAGVQFSGMRFAKNGRYEMTYKYKVIKASNDFFLQFRSASGGTASDVYSTLSQVQGGPYTESYTFELKDYSDYSLYLFPRNDAGQISIDDITLTRLKSKPRVEGVHISGDVLAGKTLSFTYQYKDLEGQPESGTSWYWFTSLDTEGSNKTVVQQGGTSLNVLPSWSGKYIGVAITPRSTYEGVAGVGDEFVFYTSGTVNACAPSSGEKIYLSEGQSFLEDFEADVGVSGNLIPYADKDAICYISGEEGKVINGSQSVYLKCNTGYFGLRIKGIGFAANGIYSVSFKYKFLTKGSQFYVQLRTDNGYAHDKFSIIDMADVTQGAVQSFNGRFALDSYNDYYLMMFPGPVGCELLIDDLKIERVSGTNVEVVNKDLPVGSTLTETFDDPLNPVLGFDYAQTPNCDVISGGDAISGRSLYFESAGSYKCLYINKGINWVPAASYKVSFKYKVLQFQDTLYFQFNSEGDSLYEQFGGFDSVGQVRQFEATFQLKNLSNYVIQIFPGSATGVTRAIIDDISFERIG